MNTVDTYRRKLAQASYNWREDHRWHRGKFVKDRRMGRLEKRSARQDVRVEVTCDMFEWEQAKEEPRGD